jgi:hypothetical protein
MAFSFGSDGLVMCTIGITLGWKLEAADTRAYRYLAVMYDLELKIFFQLAIRDDKVSFHVQHNGALNGAGPTADGGLHI